MQIVGIDFEMANAIPGSLCAYGIAHENGHNFGILALHPTRGGEQEREHYHGISPDYTAAGMEPRFLYELLVSYAQRDDVVLAAHDARIDRRALHAWFLMWDLEPLYFTWIDTLKIAQRHYTKGAKNGVAAMAERMGMTVTPHDPVHDAEVARQIALRYDWGNLVPVVDKPLEVV